MGNSSSNSQPERSYVQKKTVNRSGRKRSFKIIQGLGLFQRTRVRPKASLGRKAVTGSRRSHYFSTDLSNNLKTISRVQTSFPTAAESEACQQLNPSGRTNSDTASQGKGYSWNIWRRNRKRKKPKTSEVSLPGSILEKTSFAIYVDRSLESLEGSYKELVRMYNNPEGDDEKWAIEKELHNVHLAIENSPEYKVRQRQTMMKWESDHLSKNLKCLQQMRELVPVEIQKLSVSDLVERDFNEKLARRLVRVKALHLFHMPHTMIQKIYHGDLTSQNGRYSHVDLDIVELRALYALATELPRSRLQMKWKKCLTDSLFDMTEKEAKKTLPQRLARHPDYSWRTGTVTRSSTKRSFGRLSFTDAADREVERKKSNLFADIKKRVSVIKFSPESVKEKQPRRRSLEESNDRVENRAHDDEEEEEHDDIKEMRAILKNLSMYYSDPNEFEKALSAINFDSDSEAEEEEEDHEGVHASNASI